MDTLTHSQLVTLIAKSNGVLIVGLHCLTDARARKTGNSYGKIFKQLRAVGFVGVDYQRAVNNEAIRQGASTTFETESLPWGSWLIPNKIIVHNGGYYLRTQTTPGNRRVQPAKVICYRDSSGKYLSMDDVKAYLPPKRESTKQREQTGVDKTVWVRTYDFNSIKKIRIAGHTYALKADDTKEVRADSSQAESAIETRLARVTIAEQV